MNQHRINIKWYALGDVVAAMLTWLNFYYLRTVIHGYPFSIPPGFYIGGFLYTSGWLSLHFFSGAYESLYQKSRLNELMKTFIISLIGCFFLLFFFVLKNPQVDNSIYYLEFYSLLGPFFFLTFLIRLLFINKAKTQLYDESVFFNVLIIGSGKNATDFYQSFIRSREKRGYRINSFLNTNGANGINLPEKIKRYSNLDNLIDIINEDEIEEVIITVEKNERGLLTKILQQLSDKNVNIKIIPDTVDIISGALQTTNLLGVPLIDVHSGQLENWEKNIKRFIDIIFSISGLIILSPLLAFVALRTKFSSEGSIFYAQERIGYKGRPFFIYKFRSMVKDAEKNGPLLSSDNDPRITKWGKFMRKWRLDEIPQLWNILKGEMSLVGPRPERKFYIEQITQVHPEYIYLFKVKPGLTSWGMVKFGYASSVDEMIQRMPYDLLYIENVSILLDLRIMMLTIAIILAGKGK